MKEENKKSLRSFINNWITPSLFVIALVFFINTFLFFKVEIPSGSMLPSLNIGDKLLAKRVYDLKKLNRGDMIIFYFEPEDRMYIKRLIGLPNDEIVIKNGIVSVNGEILLEDYVKNQKEFSGEYKVPLDKYFFLGDNRADSFDSRYWDNPYIYHKDIKGKAIIKIYPFNDIEFIE